MSFILSNTMIKILVGIIVVMSLVYFQEKPNDSVPCVTVENYPGRSAVYQCPPGLSTVLLHSDKYTYATVTTDITAKAWSTHAGDDKTKAQLLSGALGPAGVIGPGAFMSMDSQNGLLYVLAPTRYVVSIAWPHN